MSRNQTGPEQRWLVCPEHEPQLQRYHAELERFGGWFLALLGIFVLVLGLFTMLGSTTGVGLSLIFLGLLMLRLPFATPQTVQMLGVRPSIWLARATGVLLILAGIWHMVSR